MKPKIAVSPSAFLGPGVGSRIRIANKMPGDAAPLA